MNKSKLFLLLLLFAFSGLLMLLTPSVGAWQTSISDCQGCGSRAQAVVVDAAGDILAIGDFFDGSDVVKLSKATGSVIWRYEVMGHESRNHAQAIAIDSHGDVFVVFSYTRVVVKVSGANGTQIWRKPIGGTLNALLPIINAVAVDRDDNVVTAGTMGGFFNVCKLDGQTGDEKWHYDARGGSAKAVAVDGNGDVAAAGIMSNNFATVKLSGTDGHEIWHDEIDGPGIFTNDFEEARAVAVGADGSIIAAGVTVDVTGELNDCTKEFTVVKYLPDGTRNWTRIINGSRLTRDDRDKLHNGASDEANAVAIDSHGDVVAAGSYQVGPDINVNAPEHFQVFKLASINGQTLWSSAAEATPPGQIPPFGRAFAISVDAADDVVAAGVHDGRFTVVKFLGPTTVGGPEEQRAWPRPFTLETGASGNGNNAVAVLMDADKNVVAAGENIGSDGWSKFTVVKLRGTDGTDYFADPSPTPTPTPTVPETVVKYAPMVYLHSDDKYRPDNPIKFVNNSSLRWFREGGCKPDNIADLHTVEPQRLGGLNAANVVAYSDNPGVPTINASDCSHISQPTFTTRDFTRPYDAGRSSYNAFWNSAYYEREGFYLDLDDGDQQDELRGGIQSGASVFPGAPVFYEYLAGRYVTYWFFYPYDDFIYHHPLLGDVSIQHHEGDWERISIQLDANETPVNVFYYAHEKGELAPWSTIDKFDGTHPVVYSAKGSHASYPGEGAQTIILCILDFCGQDSTDRGPRWLTWKSLQNVATQPWYGFEGAWGQVDAFNTPVGSFEGTNFTGPLGPSRFKNSRDKWSPRITGRVTGVDGNGLASVRIRAFDTQGNVEEEVTTCNGNPECGGVGYYSLRSLVFGRSYTLVALKEGYSFIPAVQVFRDLRENQTANFKVLDTTPPVLNLPPNIIVNADIPQGATVYYIVTATDDGTKNPRVACIPSPGTLFPIGTTTVACTATDDAGNTANGIFKVVVKGAAEQITDLITLVKGFNLQNGIENSLVVKLQNALAKAKAVDKTVACNQLVAFINEVQAQSRKKISVAQTNLMLIGANRIRAVIGC